VSAVGHNGAGRPTGLTSAQVRERLASDGPNRLPQRRGPGVLVELLRQLTHLLAVLLWVAVGLSLLAGMPSLAVAIAAVVLLNGVFAFWQEHRADRSAQRLRDLLPTGTRVVRDGRPRTVEAAELVVGDLVLLVAGDRVAADLRVVAAADLRLSEALVTGESEPVRRDVGDRLLAGTFVVLGEASAVVEATGARTALADIAALAGTATRPPSPLATQLARVVRVVAVIAAVTGVLLGTGALALGLRPVDAFLFGVGVAVALVPEGLLPTVTLSLARGAQLMAERQALVRRLDAVETLGATTFICTDKTGTITQNRMAVVDVWTPRGTVQVTGVGYEPVARLRGRPEAVDACATLAGAALGCVTGRVGVLRGEWTAQGDPMEAAVHCFALRCGVDTDPDAVPRRRPYTPERMVTSAVLGDMVWVLGAPEQVLARCVVAPDGAAEALAALTAAGRRVLAVGRREGAAGLGPDDQERALELLGLLGIEDPPREDVAEAFAACRAAGIRVLMVTGDHPRTAEAIGREVGLLGPAGVVVTASDLPDDDPALAALLDCADGAVVARVTPADKFRIARALRSRGHVVAMTGDGVNDAPALREADVGVAMGASGTDVARESADLVLLDDHVATIVAAVELGRSTFRNVRRFLTYHLTDNVAELTPFVLWALTRGRFPLAIGVLQVLALDIGTDLLPALALGAEPPSPRVMAGPADRRVVDRPLLVRAFAVLGPTEAVTSMLAFTVVLLAGGWRWGSAPSAALLGLGSGTAFATISLGQMANALACRSSHRPVWTLRLATNPLIGYAVTAELALLLAFTGVPFLARLLGGHWPPPEGWALAALGAAALIAVDGAAKTVSRRRHRDHRRGGRRAQDRSAPSSGASAS